MDLIPFPIQDTFYLQEYLINIKNLIIDLLNTLN